MFAVFVRVKNIANWDTMKRTIKKKKRMKRVFDEDNDDFDNKQSENFVANEEQDVANEEEQEEDEF
jgi:hypothetical protein